MNVYTLSGAERIRKPRAIKKSPAERILQALKGRNPNSFSAHLLRNELYRLNGTAAKGYNRPALADYKSYLADRLKLYPNEKSLLNQLIRREIAMLNAGSFTGNVAFPAVNGVGLFKKARKKLKKAAKNIVKEAGKAAKKVLKVVKTVNMAPARSAFLLLTKINARGLASGMYAGNRSQIDKLWKRFGGNPRNLNAAINQGKKKKPLLGGKQTAIRGIGDGGTISVPAAIIAASPIIVAVIKLLGTSKKTGTDPAFIEPVMDDEGGKTSVWDQLKDLGGELLNSGAVTALDPDTNVIPEDGAPDDAGLPTDDDDINKSTSFSLSPAVLLVGAGAAILLLNKS